MSSRLIARKLWTYFEMYCLTTDKVQGITMTWIIYIYIFLIDNKSFIDEKEQCVYNLGLYFWLNGLNFPLAFLLIYISMFCF